MKAFLIIILSLSFYNSAIGQQNNPTLSNIIPNPKLEKLCGTWEWLRHAPKEYNDIDSMRIVISRDSIFRIYKNGKLERESKIIIDFDNYIQINGVEASATVKNDTLYLNYICVDCSGYVYIRKH